MADTLEFNPFLPEVRDDPYPTYRRLREEAPVLPAFEGVWVLSRYEDVSMVLRDHRRFSSDGRNSDLYRSYRESLNRELTPVEDPAGRTMLFTDPPDHDRLRAIVNTAFTARRIEAMRPHIQETLDGILDALTGAGAIDLVRDVAHPLPVRVICEMLGVPDSDRHLFQGWSRDLVATLDPIMSDEVTEKANEATVAFFEYFMPFLEDRRRHPKDDLLTALINAESEGQTLNEMELLSMSILLLVAGHETTVNLVANGMLALLRDPEQLDVLCANPGSPQIRTAVEEFLRYDSPVQLVGWVALEDVEFDGGLVRRGHDVMGLLGAANHDPAQFDDPDRLDVRRPDNRHLGFGGGIHFCLGAPLARVEAQIVFATLLRRWTSIELDGEPQRRPTVTLRGLSSLPVSAS